MNRFVSALLMFAVGVLVAHADPAPITFPPLKGEALILVTDCIDGDTVRFCWLVSDVARLDGIDAPEKTGKSKALGLASREHLLSIIPRIPTRAVVKGRDKYGRALLDVFDLGGRSLSKMQIDAGHALAWSGTGKKPEKP